MTYVVSPSDDPAVMSSAHDSIDAFFSDDGPLSMLLAGFSHRPEQLEMARLVVNAMEQGRHLAIEAGAGTGKTLAYLVPALLSGHRIIIATATKTLQDQLYHRDLPMVCQVIGRPAEVAQLKGRSNYLCIHRLRRASGNPDMLAEEASGALGLIGTWALRTTTGDVGECAGVPDGSAVWPLVTSTADNCLGGRCPDIERCHVVAARRRAADADIAVVNHHLLLADMALKDVGFGRLLPGADVVIVDEAHRFPETAQAQFDISLNSRQLAELLRDAAADAGDAGVDRCELQALAGSLATGIDEVVAGLGATAEPVTIAEVPQAVTVALQGVAENLDVLSGLLADGSVELSRCGERAVQLAGAAARIANWREMSDLCWMQAGRGGFEAHLTPLDSSSQLRNMLESQGCTWIFTSATLAVGDDFGHFTNRIGLDDLQTARVASPFDYASCTRLFLPRGLPSPDSPEYTDRVIETVVPVLQASGGRAFLLFTSHRALQRAAQRLGSGAHDYTLLVQGTAPRSRLLEQFARSEEAVLLGTATFWEGVDIRGPALVVVAIDRLPFGSPGDPFLQARLELVRRNGGDPFRDYQLPQAVLILRQGVGRLIRGYSDYGIVIICDPRLTGRAYGRAFLASLPPMPVVHSAEEACAFLASCEQRT